MEQTVVNVLYTSGWIHSMHAEILKQHKISLQQYNVLRILKGQHPEAASVHTIADRMLDKNSNASRLVEKLRSKGFVSRKTCPEDRRRVDIKITPLGMETLAECTVNVLNLQETNNALTNEEHKKLNELLDKLRS